MDRETDAKVKSPYRAMDEQPRRDDGMRPVREPERQRCDGEVLQLYEV